MTRPPPEPSFPQGSIAEFDALIACYRSGQMSERQWQDHLGDAAFAAHLAGKWKPHGEGAARPVIVRTSDNTAHFGFLARRDGKEVELERARRIASANGAPVLSDIATHGIVSPSISLAAPVSIVLTEVVEIIGCTAEAQRSLETA